MLRWGTEAGRRGGGAMRMQQPTAAHGLPRLPQNFAIKGHDGPPRPMARGHDGPSRPPHGPRGPTEAHGNGPRWPTEAHCRGATLGHGGAIAAGPGAWGMTSVGSRKPAVASAAENRPWRGSRVPRRGQKPGAVHTKGPRWATEAPGAATSV